MIIGVVGFVGIGLTVAATIRNGNAQEKLQADISNIKKQLSGAKVGLIDVRAEPNVQDLTSEKDLLVGIAIGVSDGTAKAMRCYFDGFTLPGPESAEQNRFAVSRFRQTVAGAQQGPGEDKLAGTGCYKGSRIKLSDSEISELVFPAKRIVYQMAHAEWKNEAGADFHNDFCKWMEPPKTRTLNYQGWHDCTN